VPDRRRGLDGRFDHCAPGGIWSDGGGDLGGACAKRFGVNTRVCGSRRDGLSWP
jgi:hypothetical protein